MPAQSACRVLQMERRHSPDESAYPREWTEPKKHHPRFDLAEYTTSVPEAQPLPDVIRYIYAMSKKPVALLERVDQHSDEDEVKFKRLAEAWQKDTATYSSMAQIAMHPAYQNIIGMGKDALPLIFRQLQSEGDEPHHWFWALAAITTDNPVPKDSRGRIAEMSKAWLEWGRERGYVEVG